MHIPSTVNATLFAYATQLAQQAQQEQQQTRAPAADTMPQPEAPGDWAYDRGSFVEMEAFRREYAYWGGQLA